MKIAIVEDEAVWRDKIQTTVEKYCREKIGRTTYVVRVHFSKTSKETMSDKIKRMLKNEIQKMRKSDNDTETGARKKQVPGL